MSFQRTFYLPHLGCLRYRLSFRCAYSVQVKQLLKAWVVMSGSGGLQTQLLQPEAAAVFSEFKSLPADHQRHY